MKFIIGFFMAWGNFITLPCPLRRWDNRLKNMMLAFLPSVGAVIGLLWMGLFWLLEALSAPEAVAAFIMEFYIFAICGFMHLDGFMDCSDAILSRRPLEDRQRILKDSNVGAFAVVSVVFLLLAWFAAMGEAIPSLNGAELLLIPVISRAAAGLHILTCKPIGHSQYAEDAAEPGRWKYRVAVLGQIFLIGAPVLFWAEAPLAALLAAALTGIGVFAACAYGRKQLGGMSGDIAGYAICLGETAGIMTLAVI
ncbi:MAG: adenosylcobinamide-GDP ribazoletransferase [Emergencia sp.]|nr:adenosylcobinamide-GDP ribazoletransferase [Emergencia sp.]